MRIVKRIPRKDLDDFTTIIANAYPGMRIVSEEDRKTFKKRIADRLKNDSRMNLYGLYRKKRLLGVMALYDFCMKLLSVKTTVGGVGLVAVDLLHKKEKVCKEMIAFFHDYYLKKKVCMTALYPFRPDFYKRMGYGYGTKMNQYIIKPSNLPKGRSKRHIRFLNKKDVNRILTCYERHFNRTHGLMQRIRYDFNSVFNDPEIKIIGYEDKKRISGYLIFGFRPARADNFILNDIQIYELIYEDQKVLSELLTFLQTQADQINNIIYDTQDDNFHYLPIDPRDGSDDMMRPVGHVTNKQGIGIMYRVADTRGLFKVLKSHNFNGQNLRLKISIRDTFLASNNRPVIVHFVNGKPNLKRSNYDCEIKLDVAEFSSLIMGVVNFNSLFRYGLATTSNLKYLKTINKIFVTDEKPICLTAF
ncbi:MAG TPA: GNAT family N-acetyltransferase [bacterium (Candidatus Stahlbacteria)]|nr:GNAT family N-acetyltransferase [Candidatus Stahlbacteria bacterium]